ncbi:hypothetical protein CEXT_463241 [Caerostris extrusa]|uniref:Uncharacterized protein n=1 Tax=Caerostris extrusa TaxID=172846 RepID=A0AAV4SCF3_CAEEX|nr:hypothetical protein CEXT_463241 [Caerostris extrusa]
MCVLKVPFLSKDTPPSTLLRDDLPLPPPPPEITSMSECMNFDTLPPPPPEAFRNGTLDLESLPPPPALQDANEEDFKWLNESNIVNLPPPPSLQNDTNSSKCSTPEKNSSKNSVRASPAVPPKPRKGIRRRQSESDARSTPPRLSEHKNKLVVVKPKPSKNLNLALSESNPCDENTNWNELLTPASPPCSRSNRTSCVSDSKSPALCRSRRTSAPCADSKLQIHSVLSPTEPSKPTASDRKSRSQFKPSPPKRSENTKLSSAFTAPQRRSASASAAPYDQEDYPPESFLRNLQKVMVRKWKVAQQLSNENTINSHQILGFRDPNCLPTADGPHPLQRSPSSPPPLPTHLDKHKSSRSSSQTREAKANSKKHPPPPLPKKHDSKVPLW